MSFTIATTVEDAVDAMAAGARPIAGGSDLVVAARQGKADLPDDLVAIDRVAELRSIDRVPAGARIGAGVTHAELMIDETVVKDYTALADGAALVGSPATRHVGTVGGNIMNGSPAMDTGAPLAVLGATVELRSRTGTRQLDVMDLWAGPGQTTASDDELCTAVVLPPRPARSGSAYVRVETRRAMEIAVVGAAASLALDGEGKVAALACALTAVAPTILVVEALAGSLVGRSIEEETLDEAASVAADAAAPISDLRAGEAYRRHCVGVMARRAIAAAADRAGGVDVGVPVNRSRGIGAGR